MNERERERVTYLARHDADQQGEDHHYGPHEERYAL
jgi:hypothetical protein